MGVMEDIVTGRGGDWPDHKPVRVLNLISRLSRGGGIPRVVREIVARADCERIEHHVCQLRPLHSDDFDETLLEKGRYYSLGAVSNGRVGRLKEFPGASVRFAKLVGRIRPDVIHLHTGTSLIATATRALSGRGAAWLMDFHEPIEMRHSVATSVAVNGMVRGFGFAGVAHSSAVARRIRTAVGSRVPLVRIPLGVETSSFAVGRERASRWRETHDLGHDAFLVISVGRLSPMKGSGELLEIAARVLARNRDVHFVLIGNGGMRDELVDRAREAGLADRFHVLGFVDDLHAALASANLFLTASRYEGFGIAVLEAMAAGLAVVGTKIDGLIDLVVPEETGYLLSADDLDGFAERVLELAGDRVRLDRFAQNARRRAETEFDISATVRAYEDLYTALARAGPRLSLGDSANAN